MKIVPIEHMPSLFLAGMRPLGDAAFIFEKHAKMFINTTRKEVASDVNAAARAFHSIGVEASTRVAFYSLLPSKAAWIAQFAAISVRATSVIIPPTFPMGELVGVLAETHSKVVVVSTLAEAHALAAAKALLPDLTHIICLEYRGASSLQLLQWREFLAKGKAHPDHTAEILAAMQPIDTALLFYSPKDRDKGKRKTHRAARYSHPYIVEKARMMEKLLGVAHAIHPADIVVSSLSWERPVEYIASCFLPILTSAAIQINEPGDFSCFDNHPHVLVASSSYLNELRAHIERVIQEAGALEWKMMEKALAYGKRKYESSNKLGLLQRLHDHTLKGTIVKKVAGVMGGRLRLIIGVDDNVSYETQLFFHTFGADVVEMPLEMFRGE